jgi:hypothetical protein
MLDYRRRRMPVFEVARTGTVVGPPLRGRQHTRRQITDSRCLNSECGARNELGSAVG